MKNMMMLILGFLSMNILAMQEAEYKTLEGKCVISRATHETCAFSYSMFYLNDFQPWFSVAVEQFHVMTCFSPKTHTRTSPVSNVSKKNGAFFVRTQSSVYRVLEEDLLFISSMEEFLALYKEILDVDITNAYLRRDISEIIYDIEEGQILKSQSYKTWISYDHSHDNVIFNSNLKELKDGDEISFPVLTREEMTLLGKL